MRSKLLLTFLIGHSLSGGATPARALPSAPPEFAGHVAYVIVTRDALASEFERLADWKTRSGVPAWVETLDAIRRDYAGADDAERIRAFLQDAHATWGTQWVLLGGDTETIPVRYAFTAFYGGASIPTDLYYSCLERDWNADGDARYGEAYASPADPGDDADLTPDVFVGRAPVTTLAEARVFVDKTLQYERTPAGDYENGLLFMAEASGPTAVEPLLADLHTHPSLAAARLYQDYTNPAWAPGALPLSFAAGRDSISRGYHLVFHAGGGGAGGLSMVDGILDTASALGLANGIRLSNLLALHSNINQIDASPIGEAFMRAAHGGAVTCIGASAIDFHSAHDPLDREYFRLVYRDSVNAVGEALARSKLPFVPFANFDGVHRWEQLALLLLGDPELRMWTGTPRALAAEHPVVLAVGDSVIPVHVSIAGAPVEGARVTAYRAGDQLQSVVTDAAGVARVPFSARSAGRVELTVTGYDCRPHVAAIAIVSPNGVEVGGTTGITLAPPEPNPARETARLVIDVPPAFAGAPAELELFDLSGRRVRRLASGPARAGRSAQKWDLRDDLGIRVGAGVYFARFTLGGEMQARRLLVLR